MIAEAILVVGMLSMSGFFPEPLFFMAIIGIYLKLLALLGLILFFSTFISPALALFMTLASYIIGHSGYVILQYAKESLDPMFFALARGILGIFPNLESLNLKNYVATDAIVDSNMYMIAFGMAVVYTGIITFLAAKIFEKRSFDAV